MNEKTMTLRQGIQEVKLADKKIESLCAKATLLSWYSNTNPLIGTMTAEEKSVEIESEMQAIADLQRYRNAVKRHVMEINGSKKLSVPVAPIYGQPYDEMATEEITIAEAIYRKAYYADVFIKQVQTLHRTAEQRVGQFQEAHRKAKSQSENLAQARISATPNIAQDKVAEVYAQEFENLAPKIINPIGIEKYFEPITDAINQYLITVDSRLSMVSETTEFTVTW